MASLLYIKKRALTMKQIHFSLMLAAAMIGIALLAIFEFVPEEAAQYSPLFLLALFPAAWMRGDNTCNLVKHGKEA